MALNARMRSFLKRRLNIRQLALIAPDPGTASTCAQAGRTIVRGVVAAGLDVVADEPEGEVDGAGREPGRPGGPAPGGVRH